MSNWTTDACPGYRSKTIKSGNCTIVIHRPLLTKEEAAIRERQVLSALEGAMRGYVFKEASTS